MSNCSCGGNGRRCCENCPPCDNAIPESCEYLDVVAEAQRVVVEDEQGCKKTLANAADPALIQDNGDGTVTANTGAVGDEINLSALQTQVAGSSTLVGQQADGDLAKILPTNDGEDYLHVSTGTTGEFVDKNELYGTGGGVLVQDANGLSGGTANDIALQSGATGQVLAIDVNGNARFENAGGLVTSACIDSVGVEIYPITNLTFGVNVGYVVLESSTGAKLQVSAFSGSVNILQMGLEGRDSTTTLSANTFYWVYLVVGELGVTPRIYYSSNPTSPSAMLNPGETFFYYRKIGGIVTNASTQLSASGFHQSGNVMTISQGLGLVANPYSYNGTTRFTASITTATGASGAVAFCIPSNYVSQFIVFSQFYTVNSGTTTGWTSIGSFPTDGQYASVPVASLIAANALLMVPSRSGITYSLYASAMGGAGSYIGLVESGYVWNFI